MIKLTSRRAALVLAGSAVALVGGMLPAQAATTGWRPVAKLSVKGEMTLLTGVDAVTKSDAWAVGGAVTTRLTKPVGIIEHWTGRSWRRVGLPAAVAKTWNRDSGLSFPVVGASSATNVWAFSQNLVQSTSGDGYLRLNGSKWTVGTLPGTRPTAGHLVVITGTRVISTKDVWVFGGKLNTAATTLSFTPYAAQYNGHKWTRKSVPGAGAVVGVSEISAGNMWAVTGTPQIYAGSGISASTSSVDHWNGKAWAAAPLQPTSALPQGATLTSVLASRGGHVWIGGGATNSKGGTTEFAAELTGPTWTLSTKVSAPASSADYALTSMAPDGHGGIWAVAGGAAVSSIRIWHLTGGAWTGPSSPSFGSSKRILFQLAAVPGTSSVWGVGAVARGTSTEGLIALVGPTPR